MPVSVPTVRDLDEIERARAAIERTAASLDQRIYCAVEELVTSGAIPREEWRFLAHILFCRAIYTTHIAPLEDRLTFEQIANHLKEIGVPRFRGASDWSASAISDIRAVVSSPQNRISLPDP